MKISIHCEGPKTLLNSEHLIFRLKFFLYISIKGLKLLSVTIYIYIYIYIYTHTYIYIYRTIILPVVLYGCETWSLTLREEHRLRMLRRVFGPKRDEVTGMEKIT